MPRSDEDRRAEPEQRRESAALPWEELQRAVQQVRYGVVQLIIQDGRVVQIDRTEKIRLV